MVIVAVDPVGSILALPDHLNDEGRLSSYKVGCLHAWKKVISPRVSVLFFAIGLEASVVLP